MTTGALVALRWATPLMYAVTRQTTCLPTLRLPRYFAGIGKPGGRLAYGLGAAMLGGYLAGDVLDRRAPELLSAVSPRR